MGCNHGSPSGDRRRQWTAWSGIVVAAIVVVVTAGGACWPRDESLDAPLTAGVIRIGYAVEAPYAFVDERGEVTGESPEIGRRVARDLGIARVEWVQTRFDRLIPELLAGRFDVIAAGMFVTAERARRISFSRPTFRVGPGLLVLADVHDAPASCSDARERPEVQIAALRGAVESEQLHACLGADQVVEVPDAAAGRAAVLTDLASGLALSAPTLRWMAAAEDPPRTKVVAFDLEADATGYGAFGFRREDRALRAAWDVALGRFLGTPEHLATVAPLGFAAEEAIVAPRGAP